MVRPGPHERQQVDLGPRPGAHADHHDPGPRGQVGQDGLDAGGPDQFEGDVVGAVVGDGVGQDHLVRAQGPHPVVVVGLRTEATTRAPATAASWTAAVPTPPAAPEISTVSSSHRSAWVNSASCAVEKASGNPPAAPGHAVGHRQEGRLGHHHLLGLAATTADPHHPGAGA